MVLPKRDVIRHAHAIHSSRDYSVFEQHLGEGASTGRLDSNRVRVFYFMPTCFEKCAILTSRSSSCSVSLDLKRSPF